MSRARPSGSGSDPPSASSSGGSSGMLHLPRSDVESLTGQDVRDILGHRGGDEHCAGPCRGGTLHRPPLLGKDLPTVSHLRGKRKTLARLCFTRFFPLSHYPLISMISVISLA